jgi:hypothetical protein
MRKNCRWNRFMLLVPVVLMTGCNGTPAYQGSDREILATYRVRRLGAELPGTVRVPAALAAAKAALLRRGYAIKSATATEDAGEVTAVPADAGLLESLSIDIRRSSRGTRVQIIAEPIGDQTKSRAVLDAMLTELGL